MKKLLFSLFTALVVLSSCNEDGTIEVETPTLPVITLDSETGVYTVKAGRELLISPTYEYADEAAFVWSAGGGVIGREPSLTFLSEKTGEVFVQLEVTNRYGKASEELRVDVLALEVPAVSLAGAEEGYVVLTGSELGLSPVVTETSLPTTYVWTVNGEKVSAEKQYTFSNAQTGTYTLTFSAENEDGKDSIEFTIRVCTADEMPVAWTFPQTEFNMSAGRTICLKPLDIANADGAVYTWTVDGKQVQQGADPAYNFTSAAEGKYTAAAMMTKAGATLSQTLTVNVCPTAGTYYRAGSAAGSADWTQVYAFIAAPGQFVNEGYTATTDAEACAFAESQMRKNTFVSLGGFGGYIVVGFDHSIDNSGSYDLAIVGNSFESSSEPGIVWVMQDENGDGLPNDTWYELKGSETGKNETIADYAVTYYRPRGVRTAVPWTDNRGGSGEIDYLSMFHTQDYYYPAWVAADSYTLRGTCLAARNYDDSGDGSYWINAKYDWGYADNFSSIDRLSDDGNTAAGANANHFRISDAIRFDGRAAELKYIDFVKVQTGVNAKSGWLGELSTEVFGFYDYSMRKE